ncbi:5-guanidino-2-oxopentanoate decarboxylase [Sinorhizobium medicae]|uniref:5-guanidino-2-oxopentanoate decarboxylase n=2 Tax=Sinorhizobium medicae TaxID=110321 RepID=UPI0012949435|nr:5-guanidino-2-oxopentanoate decarboxylase [Sinorhizobium medicae]MDX0978530.1 5-guanidino-2-oxopentanoate decarboxylase [Sinorhizobium medicae]MQV87767.1 5-guanidino-2-oxopentanoate decarboxylase [Sinorhizobium medicae]MQV94506.1 5-guanidino-2-oxopentanoate decarboxylase [Sinorhizobium medicae]
MKTVGLYLVELLAAYGVDTVFGIPGVHTVEMYRGLPRSGIRHFTPRHEQGAGFMADGYARATGKPGVCFIISGPGLTNIATAMAQAYGDSVPMLVITSVNPPGRLGSGEGHLHELPDQRQLGRQFTAFSHTILRADELAQVVARAFAVFASARPRPVHIELPVDLLTADASALPPARKRPVPSRPAAEPQAVAAAAALCTAALRPIILAGGGAADAAVPMRRLAEALDAPVIMTVNGRGVLPAGHPLGVPCSPAMEATRALIETADLVIAAGTEFGPTDYDFYETGGARIGGKLIRIDIDAEQAMRGRPADQALISDAALALEALAAAVSPRPPGDGAARAKLARSGVRKALNPILRAGAHLMEVVRDTLPGVVIVGDSAQPVYAGCIDYAATRPRSWFCSATGYGTLGYALPAATGALIGTRRPTVCLIGDGGIQFTLPELGSAREAELPLIVLLWNNNGYGEIKSYMETRGIEPIGVDIFTPDFLTISRGFGCEAHRMKDHRELPALLEAALLRRCPTVIEIVEADYIAAINGQEEPALPAVAE